MSDTSFVIRKYYNSIKDHKIDSAKNQIDNIMDIATGLMHADFCGLFYSRKDKNKMVPVANFSRVPLTELELNSILKKWSRLKKDSVIETKVFKCGDKSIHSQLNYCTQFPLYENEKLKCFIIGYWLEQPENQPDKMLRHIQKLMKLVLTVLNKDVKTNIQNDYFYRLSELISMFEIPVGSVDLDTLLKNVVEHAENTIPEFEYTILKYDDIENRYHADRTFNKYLKNSEYVKNICGELKSFVKEVDMKKLSGGFIFDFTHISSLDHNKAFLTPLLYELRDKVFLLCQSKNGNELSQNDLELLSVFSLFSSNIIRDAKMVSKLTRANNLLKKSSNQLMELEVQAALTDMTSGLAHDFNNTIGGIIGRTQLLKLKVKDEKILNNLNKIEELALSGADTVKRIQEYTSAVRSKTKDKIDLIRVLSDYSIRKDLNWPSSSSEKNVRVIYDYRLETADIDGSAVDLMVVLDKLIENAVEYSDPDNNVTVSLSENRKYFVLQVKNVGKPIDPKLRQKIFYPFYTTKSDYGSGLGLAIVQGIIVRHGGKIKMVSDEKQGTIFYIYLPKPDRTNEDSDITDKKQKKEHLRILVVDDDEQIREVLNDMLTIDGHDITVCEDGSSALKEFDSDNFDLMITDLGMPGMSGLDLAGTVHKEKPEMPIFLITGWGTQIDDKEAALKGIKTVLPKPFHLKDIKEAINGLVEQK